MHFSRRALCAILAGLCVALPACGGETQSADTTASPAETTVPAAASLDILSLPIVRPDEAADLMLESVKDLYKAIKARNDGATLGTDWVKKGETPDPSLPEFLVGLTNRQVSIDLHASLEPGTFTIAATDHQFVIVGSDYLETWQGVCYFLDEMLTGNAPGLTITDTAITVEPGFRYTSEAGAATPSTILNSTDTFIAKASVIGPISRIGNYKTMQGGCAIGEYGYYALINTVDFPESAVEGIIVKYDLATGEEVDRSKSIVMDHANDITYVPETNELYVVSCYVDSRRINILDADTLEFKGRKSLVGGGDGCYALEYNPLRKQFVSGCGRVNMNIYDENLEHVRFVAGKGTTLVTQGICADDKYIYHVLYSAKSNEKEPDHVIFVFDWEGNFVSNVRLTIPKAYEPENIALIGDTFYIACNNANWTGGLLFKAKIVKE